MKFWDRNVTPQFIMRVNPPRPPGHKASLDDPPYYKYSVTITEVPMTPEEVADYARWRPSYKSKGVSNTAADIQRRRLYSIRKQEYLAEYRAKLLAELQTTPE